MKHKKPKANKWPKTGEETHVKETEENHELNPANET